MSKPIIQVEGIGKSYKISHELKASVGNVSIRDGINNIARKPIELITGHRMRQEKFWALKDVNFEVNQGEVVGIIGKNGSGKSTLLKILSRITEPTTGEIRMHGRVASLLEVGTGFHPELTGRENVYFNGSILGMRKKEIESKFDEIVAFSEVEKFLDTPVKFYSSGMYVRLAFAVAAHLEPDILIVDEVLAVGDTAFQKKCLGKMKDVASQGRTVLFVSHNMHSVRQLCSSAILLESGAIVSSGSVAEVSEEYFTRSFGLQESTAEWKHSSKIEHNRYVKVESVKLLDKSGRLIEKPILNTSEITVDIDLEVLEQNDNLTVGYCLNNTNGDSIYWSYQTDHKNYRMLRKGKYNIISKLKTEILNEGEYTLTVIGGIHFSEWIYSPENSPIAVDFKLKLANTNASELYNSKRPTILSPVIEWDVRKL